MTKKDNIFSTPIEKLGDFVFDEAVTAVFPDMIKRSVPGYSDIVTTIGKLAKQYATEKSNIYDLGCSLGAVTVAIKKNITLQNINIIGVDNSPAMVDKCKNLLTHFNYNKNREITILCDDVCNIKIQNASMVVLNFTLQFIETKKRNLLIKKIFDGLNPNGLLIISEKFSFADELINDVLLDLHYSFKKSNDYSELEISQKRTALENVMLTDTIEQHKNRLKLAGFQHVELWYQCFNFGSLLAIKK